MPRSDPIDHYLYLAVGVCVRLLLKLDDLFVLLVIPAMLNLSNLFDGFYYNKIICAILVWGLVNYIVRAILKRKKPDSLLQIKDVNIHLNGVVYPVSYWVEIGSRKYQEDRFICAIPNGIANTPKSKLKRSTKEENEVLLVPSLFCVFDGHGGNAASEFCKENFANYFLNEELSDLLIDKVQSAFAKSVER